MNAPAKSVPRWWRKAECIPRIGMTHQPPIIYQIWSGKMLIASGWTVASAWKNAAKKVRAVGQRGREV